MLEEEQQTQHLINVDAVGIDADSLTVIALMTIILYAAGLIGQCVQ